MKYLIFIILVGVVVVFAWMLLKMNIAPVLSPSPSPSETATQTPVSGPNIEVTSPQENDEIGLSLIITGSARVFERVFAYRLRDSDGAVLIEGHAMTSGTTDIGELDPFNISINYPKPKGSIGVLEVYQVSAKDGTEIDKVSVPVSFKTVETTTFKIYLGNSKLNSNAEDCSKVFPVSRRVAKTSTPVRASLDELLKGPWDNEGKDGYLTSIPDKVKINSVVLSNNGTLTADFNETLQQGVGGSCRVAAIRAQITETIKQFSTVNKVVISINGKTEDILQP